MLCLLSLCSDLRSGCIPEPPSAAGMALWSLLEVVWHLPHPTRSLGSSSTEVKPCKVLAWPWVDRSCSDPCQCVVSLLPGCFPAATPPNLSSSILLMVELFQPLSEGACTPGTQSYTHCPGQKFSFVHGDFSVPSLSPLSCSHLPAGSWSCSWHPRGLRLFLQHLDFQSWLLYVFGSSTIWSGLLCLFTNFPCCCLCCCQPVLPVPAGLSCVTSWRCWCSRTSFVIPSGSAVPAACLLGCCLLSSQASVTPALHHC